MTAFVFDVAAHAGLEVAGAWSVSCATLLCGHDHFSGRLAPLNRVVHSRAYRWALTGLVALVTAFVALLVLDAEALHAGAASVLAVHLAVELVGAVSRSGVNALAAARGLNAAPRRTLLGVLYLVGAVVTVLLAG